jgi:hypothetical protein
MIQQAQLIISPQYYPLIVSQAITLIVGFINTDATFTEISYDDYSYTIITPNNLTDLHNGQFIPLISGSYSIQYIYILDDVEYINQYSFYVAAQISLMDFNRCFYILKQELPSCYNNNAEPDKSGNYNSGNYLDNYASAQVLAKVLYSTIYNMAATQQPSRQYNTNWEYQFNATNNLFLNAYSPQRITWLLYQIPTITSVNKYNILLFISRFCYYWIGQSIIVYIDGSNNITIYYGAIENQWILGDAVHSILGSTTYLGTASTSITIFENMVATWIRRILPVQIKYTLTFTATIPDNLVMVGATYPNDPRLFKGMAYTGDTLPFNVIGYELT